jgi:hypothetical protein
LEDLGRRKKLNIKPRKGREAMSRESSTTAVSLEKATEPLAKRMIGCDRSKSKLTINEAIIGRNPREKETPSIQNHH